ncbi:MAG: carbohydrate ABC transporter permease [Ruminococcaceae bacterium]|nr:carbohydrate ABC transporter permease [Oscillospiraceae bacterium]
MFRKKQEVLILPSGAKALRDSVNDLKAPKRQRSSKSEAKRYTRSKVGNFFYFAFIICGGVFAILPLVYCLCTSLKPLDEILIFPPRFFVHRPTFANYAALPELLSSLRVPLSRYIFNSLFVTLGTTFLYVVVASMAAFVLCKSNIKFKKTIFYIIQFSLLFNAYTLAVPQYLIFTWMNIVDTYWVCILPHFASTMGVFLMKQYMEGSLPNALLEAAKIDGAGYYRIFWQIVMPIVKPMWLTLTLFTFRDVWASVPQGTIFSETLKTLPTIMSQITAGGVARSGSAMAVTCILMIPPITVYMISQSNVMESMSSAGIKE